MADVVTPGNSASPGVRGTEPCESQPCEEPWGPLARAATGRLDTNGLTQPESGPVGASVGHNQQVKVQPTMRKRAGYYREYRAKRSARRAEGGLLPFQQSFVSAVCRRENPPDIAALSVARGNGKSWLAGKLVARSITPDDQLFVEGAENILVASSKMQAQIVLEFSRDALGESSDYRWRADGVTHLDTRTRVRVISSDSRRALGLGAKTRLIVADEPAAWSPTAGKRLWDAITGAIGKRQMTVIAIGTIAPAPLTGPASWWPAHIAEGSGDGRHVQLLQADPKKWADFAEVLRCNPVAHVNPFLRRTLEREHRRALASERAALNFKQFRLNLPGGGDVDQQPLVTAAEWERIVSRPVPGCEGKPIVGIDLGGSRSWSAACALWPNGRIESWAVAPGHPSLAEQERQDQVPDSTYAELVRAGGLSVDTDRAVPDIGLLLARIWAWEPLALVSDPFRSAELHQVVLGRVRVVERAKGGSESTSNVQSLRSLLLDSASGVTLASRALLAAAFAQTNLVIDNSGVTRVTKVDRKRSRDDAAAALLLAAGELARRPAPVELRGAIISRGGQVTWI